MDSFDDEIRAHLVDLVDVGLLVDLLHGAGAGLERGERLRGRLAALQRDDLLLELELLVLELLNLLLVELLLLEALQRGALVLGAVEVLRLLELGRHLLMQQRLALLEHGQRLRDGMGGEGQRMKARFAGRFFVLGGAASRGTHVLQLLDRAQGARLRRAEAPAAGSGTPAAPAAGTLASEQFLEHPPSKDRTKCHPFRVPRAPPLFKMRTGTRPPRPMLSRLRGFSEDETRSESLSRSRRDGTACDCRRCGASVVWFARPGASLTFPPSSA